MAEVRVAILGASGYTGGELLRLLALHSRVEVFYVTSREYTGRPVHHAHPHLRGFYEGLRFEDVRFGRASEADVVFNAMPHGVATRIVADLYDSGVRVVDLSADYRLKDPSLYKLLYGFEHPRPDLLEKSVYGLPELNRGEMRGSRLIAIPGCNAAAGLLAIAPLARAGLLEEPVRVVIDVKASSSEAGSKPSRSTHYPEREGSIRPYSASGHRHAFEVSQELSKLAGRSVRVSMVAHAVPAVRGVLASAHSWVSSGVGLDRIARAYSEFYRGERFVVVKYVSDRAPHPLDVKNVIGSNMAEVGYALDPSTGRVTGFAAIDNLVKGGAGQAVQAMNIMLGFDEAEGLLIPALRP